MGILYVLGMRVGKERENQHGARCTNVERISACTEGDNGQKSQK